MIKLLVYFFLGISLSMDAFIVNLSIGSNKPSNKISLIIILLIGLFHFIMPLIGFYLGSLFLNKMALTNYLPSIILFLIAFEMMVTKNNQEYKVILKPLTITLIAFSVSIDSLATGVALGINQENIIISSIIISLSSILFSYLGLKTGKNILSRQKLANNISIFLMFLVAIKFLFK